MCSSTAARKFSTSELQKVLWDPQLFSILTSKCAPPLRRKFSTSELQKVLWDPQLFSILTSKCASCHSGVQFLISPLTTWLRPRRFNELPFRLTRRTFHWKNTTFRDFSNIWRGWIFFLLTFALLHLRSSDFTSSLCSSYAFQLSILSEVYYLNFLGLYWVWLGMLHL